MIIISDVKIKKNKKEICKNVVYLPIFGRNGMMKIMQCIYDNPKSCRFSGLNKKNKNGGCNAI